MYSPKIREDLIPILYRIAKARGVAMTTLVNGIVEREIGAIEQADQETVMIRHCSPSFRPEDSQCRAPPSSDYQTI